MSEHPLRDLSRQIRAVAAAHPAYSQGADVVRACCDHLDAVARTHETRGPAEPATASMIYWARAALLDPQVAEDFKSAARDWLLAMGEDLEKKKN
jgi:hypothetical protein